MPAGAVTGVLGAAQLVGGISQASAQRRQVNANNAAQARQIAAQRDQIAVQEKATFEQAALQQMEFEQNKRFSDYQATLGQLERQTAMQQQVAALQAQGQLEQMTAQQQQYAIDSERLGGLLTLEQQRIQNEATQIQSGIQGMNARGQTEQGRYEALSQGQQALTGNAMENTQTQIGLAGAGTQNEMQRYQAMLSGADQQQQAAVMKGQAEINEQQTLAGVAQQARGVYGQLEGEALAEGRRLTAGERRRATMQAMMAAAGGMGSQSDQAILSADKGEDAQTFIESQLRMNGISDETAIQMVNEGRIAELTKLLGVQDASRVDRKAIEAALLANIQANATNESIGMQSDFANRLANYKNSGVLGQMSMANMSAEQQQAIIALQEQAAQAEGRMTGNLINGQEQMLNQDAAAQKEDIIRTMMLNGMGREAAMQTFEAAMKQDEHTDKINRIMAETGFQLQAGAATSQAQAQLGSLASQKGSLQYTPQRAPSMLGGILSSAISAGSTVYGGIQQQRQTDRATALQMGQVPQEFGVSSLTNVNQSVPAWQQWTNGTAPKSVNSNVGILSSWGSK